MCYRISISISRWPWRRRKSLTSAASGGQRWGQSSRGGLAPLVSSRYRRATGFVFSAARSDAPRHLVGTARLPDEVNRLLTSERDDFDGLGLTGDPATTLAEAEKIRRQIPPTLESVPLETH